MLGAVNDKNKDPKKPEGWLYMMETQITPQKCPYLPTMGIKMILKFVKKF